MQRVMKKIYILCMLFSLLLIITSCGSKETEQPTTEEPIQNGAVESSADFEKLGLIVDVAASNLVSNVSYEIKNQEVAIVHFTYNGIDCEFRGSAVYSEFELAEVENTNAENMIVSSIDGWNATYFTLDPGRVIFWSDDHIHYSLHVYVTAEDSVLDSIVPSLIYEDHYTERADVIASQEASAKEFATQIVSAIQSKDMQTLAEMMNFPQDLGDDISISSKTEFLSMQPDAIFTDALLDAIDEAAVDNLRAGRDEDSYLIGSSTKNVYFRMTEENTYKIVKINN